MRKFYPECVWHHLQARVGAVIKKIKHKTKQKERKQAAYQDSSLLPDIGGQEDQLLSPATLPS